MRLRTPFGVILAVWAVLAVFSDAARAQLFSPHPPASTVANRPAAAGPITVAGYTIIRTWWVTDGQDSGDPCDAGGGTTQALCGDFGGSGWNQINGSGGGGSGDIESVWSDTTGDVSALTAAAGDSLDCGSADSCSPTPRSTTLPATCTEGFFYQDTDSGGSEVYACTATNTWTKFIAATDNVATATALAANGTNCSAGNYPLGVDASGNAESCTAAGGGSALGDDYRHEHYPDSADCFACEEWTSGADQLTWRDGNISNCTRTYGDGMMALECTDAAVANRLEVRWTDAPASGDWRYFWHGGVTLSNNGACGVAVLTAGTEATPTEIYFLALEDDGTNFEVVQERWTSYTSGSAATTTFIVSADDNWSGVEEWWLMWGYFSGNLFSNFALSGRGRNADLAAQAEATVISLGVGCEVGRGTSPKIIVSDLARIIDTNPNLGGVSAHGYPKRGGP